MGFEPCSACGGSGTTAIGAGCSACGGTGRVTRDDSPSTSSSKSQSSSSSYNPTISAAEAAAAAAQGERDADKLLEKIVRVIDLDNKGYKDYNNDDYNGAAAAFSQLIDIITDPSWEAYEKKVNNRVSELGGQSWKEKFDHLKRKLNDYKYFAASSYFMCGTSKSKNGDYTGAIEDLNTAIYYCSSSTNPEHQKYIKDYKLLLGRYYFNLANQYADKEDGENAMANYQEAVNLGNEDAIEFLKAAGLQLTPKPYTPSSPKKYENLSIRLFRKYSGKG